MRRRAEREEQDSGQGREDSSHPLIPRFHQASLYLVRFCSSKSCTVNKNSTSQAGQEDYGTVQSMIQNVLLDYGLPSSSGIHAFRQVLVRIKVRVLVRYLGMTLGMTHDTT